MVKSFEVCDLPVRSAKFIVRKSWFIAASDDMFLRVYNYNTMEKVKAWEAHMDYIRYKGRGRGEGAREGGREGGISRREFF